VTLRSSARVRAVGSSLSADQRTGLGCTSHRWTSRPAASAARTASWSLGNRVTPNNDSRGGSATRSGRARNRAQAVSSRSAGLGAPIAARSPRHSIGCQSRSSGIGAPVPSVSEPAAQRPALITEWAA
jgi:hypothetical protein